MPPTLWGKTRQVIHLLTRAEKRVQLGTVISPLLAGTLPGAAQDNLTRGKLTLEDWGLVLGGGRLWVS